MQKQFNVKRFKIETSTLHNKFLFIKEGEGNYLETVTTIEDPVLAFEKGRGSQIRRIKYKVGKNVEVTGWKTIGTRLEDYSKSTTMQWVAANEKKQGELFE
jgi:topoisomerase-4 subunit A